MSILTRFARSKDPEVDLPDLPAECGHWEMAPRWDNAEDMGQKEKITFLTCTNCGESFSPEEAERLAAVA